MLTGVLPQPIITSRAPFVVRSQNAAVFRVAWRKIFAADGALALGEVALPIVRPGAIAGWAIGGA